MTPTSAPPVLVVVVGGSHKIPAELDLAGAGLEYLPMDPFATGFFRDGRIVRFHPSIEATVDSIAEHSRADAYAPSCAAPSRWSRPR